VADFLTGVLMSRAVPILDDDGNIQEWFGAATDVTERRRGEEARILLIGELNHRVKNMLTVVQSIASQTRRTSDSMEQFVVAFESRIRALAAAHALLTRSQWSDVDLGEVAHSAAATFMPRATDRVRIAGPEVKLRPDSSISVAMALHELGTNAMKYGALSADRGTVELNWSVHDQRLSLNWVERDGPKVTPPEHEGFGMRLLKRGLTRELDGTVQVEFRDDGLRCLLEFPLESS
jgi:two-component system, chemotaxis family, CheB/CheR fusion protein